MKNLTLIASLLIAMTALGQTPTKQLTPEQKRIKVERYKAYLIKKNRERDSIYQRGVFRIVDTFRSKDSDIMKRILREDEIKKVKRDSISKISIQKK